MGVACSSAKQATAVTIPPPMFAPPRSPHPPHPTPRLVWDEENVTRPPSRKYPIAPVVGTLLDHDNQAPVLQWGRPTTPFIPLTRALSMSTTSSVMHTPPDSRDNMQSSSDRLSARRGALCTASSPDLEQDRRATPPSAITHSMSQPELAWNYITIKVRTPDTRVSDGRRIAYVYTSPEEAKRDVEIPGIVYTKVAVPSTITQRQREHEPPSLMLVSCGASPPDVMYITVARMHSTSCSAIEPPCTSELLCVLWGPLDLPLQWRHTQSRRSGPIAPPPQLPGTPV